MQKAELRRSLLQKRKQYLPAEIEEKSQRIADIFFAHFSLQAIQTLHVFLPIRSKNEVNTWPIIRQLQHRFPAIRIAVSVSNMQNCTLSHFWLQPDTKLTENKWGIPEPVNAQEIPGTEINLVLVPLLAFDNQGHRVGYGKGFYDRFLKACKPETIKIGLSFETGLTKISDVHPDDVVLDYAITPAEIVKFG